MPGHVLLGAQQHAYRLPGGSLLRGGCRYGDMWKCFPEVCLASIVCIESNTVPSKGTTRRLISVEHPTGKGLFD